MHQQRRQPPESAQQTSLSDPYLPQGPHTRSHSSPPLEAWTLPPCLVTSSQWTGRPGVLRFTGSQRVGHDWATELNWTEFITPFVKMVYKPLGITAALGLHFFSMEASMHTYKLKYYHQIFKKSVFCQADAQGVGTNPKRWGESFPTCSTWCPQCLVEWWMTWEPPWQEKGARAQVAGKQASHWLLAGRGAEGSHSSPGVQGAVRQETDTAAQERALRLKGNPGISSCVLRRDMHRHQGQECERERLQLALGGWQWTVMSDRPIKPVQRTFKTSWA